jgi:hypothetical protein
MPISLSQKQCYFCLLEQSEKKYLLYAVNKQTVITYSYVNKDCFLVFFYYFVLLNYARLFSLFLYIYLVLN